MNAETLARHVEGGASVRTVARVVYDAHLAGHRAEEIGALLGASVADVEELIAAGREMAEDRRSFGERRADSLARIAMLQARALEAFAAAPSPAWLAEVRRLEELRGQIEGTAGAGGAGGGFPRVQLYDARIMLPRKDDGPE